MRVQRTVVLQQAPWRPAGVTAHFLSPEIKELLTRSLTPVEMSSRNEVHVKERRGCSQKICTVVKEVLHTERKSFWKERKKWLWEGGKGYLMQEGKRMKSAIVGCPGDQDRRQAGGKQGESSTGEQKRNSTV